MAHIFIKTCPVQNHANQLILLILEEKKNPYNPSDDARGLTADHKTAHDRDKRKQNHFKSKLYIVYTCIFTFYFICPLIQHECAHIRAIFFSKKMRTFVQCCCFVCSCCFGIKNGISFLLEAVFYSRDGESGKSVESCNRKRATHV